VGALAKLGGGAQGASASLEGQATPHVPLHRTASGSPPRSGEDKGRTKPLSPTHGLDGSWERKLAQASIEPDFTLDLHGHTLDQAHARLDSGLMQAKAMGARLVLLITGNPRPVDAADRGSRRGAIRAKVLDWLAAGPHGADVAAVRPAHRRHGGAGALYLVLRRRR
jgi:DNA-nicking Smr family endonuclease